MNRMHMRGATAMIAIVVFGPYASLAELDA